MIATLCIFTLILEKRLAEAANKNKRRGRGGKGRGRGRGRSRGGVGRDQRVYHFYF